MVHHKNGRQFAHKMKEELKQAKILYHGETLFTLLGGNGQSAWIYGYEMPRFAKFIEMGRGF